MPKNETVLTPMPRRVRLGIGTLDGIVRVVGNSIEVAESTTVGLFKQGKTDELAKI